MEVYFKTNKLQRVCNSQQELQKAYGKENARKIMMRLNELLSVKNLSQISEIPPPRRHPLQGDRKGQFAVDVKQPYRIVFEPCKCEGAYDAAGQISLAGVTGVMILDVEDYHGK